MNIIQSINAEQVKIVDNLKRLLQIQKAVSYADIKRVMDGHAAISDLIEQIAVANSYEAMSKYVSAFVEEKSYEPSAATFLIVKEIHFDYRSFCKRNEYKFFERQSFVEQLRLLGFRAGRERIRDFHGKEEVFEVIYLQVKSKPVNNSVEKFINHFYYSPDDENYELLKDLYLKYKQFCINDQREFLGKKQFRQQLEALGFVIKRRYNGTQVFLVNKWNLTGK